MHSGMMGFGEGTLGLSSTAKICYSWFGLRCKRLQGDRVGVIVCGAAVPSHRNPYARPARVDLVQLVGTPAKVQKVVVDNCGQVHPDARKQEPSKSGRLDFRRNRRLVTNHIRFQRDPRRFMR